MLSNPSRTWAGFNIVWSLIPRLPGLKQGCLLHFSLSQQLYHFRVRLSLSSLSAVFKQKTRRTGESKTREWGSSATWTKKNGAIRIWNLCLTYSAYLPILNVFSTRILTGYQAVFTVVFFWTPETKCLLLQFQGALTKRGQYICQIFSCTYRGAWPFFGQRMHTTETKTHRFCLFSLEYVVHFFFQVLERNIDLECKCAVLPERKPCLNWTFFSWSGYWSFLIVSQVAFSGWVYTNINYILIVT